MRLEWLEDLIAVAETGSFQEAADRRHLTQSAFSRRIKHIEDHVGVELFDRARKPVHLNGTMAEQLEQIARLAQELRQLVSDLQRGARMASSRLTLASQHALTTAMAPGILWRVQKKWPGIYVRLRSANLDACFSQLLSRQADIALVYRLTGEDHPIGAEFVETVTIGTDLLIPVISQARAEAVQAALAAGELPYIAYPQEVFLGHALRAKILPRLRGLNRLLPKAETALTLAALEMASAGLAVAWVPASLAQDRIGAGKLTDLSALLPTCPLEVTAVRLFAEPSEVVRAVWAEMTDSAAQ